MSKSIKLKDSNYWDSTSIVYGTTKLDKKIEASDTAIINAQETATSGLNKANANATQITNIINRIAGWGEQAKIISDPDSLGLASGFYRYNGNFGGKTSTSWWFIIHLAHYDVNGNFCRQLIFNYWGNQMMSRVQTSGNWGSMTYIIE